MQLMPIYRKMHCRESAFAGVYRQINAVDAHLPKDALSRIRVCRRLPSRDRQGAVLSGRAKGPRRTGQSQLANEAESSSLKLRLMGCQAYPGAPRVSKRSLPTTARRHSLSAPGRLRIFTHQLQKYTNLHLTNCGNHETIAPTSRLCLNRTAPLLAVVL